LKFDSEDKPKSSYIYTVKAFSKKVKVIGQSPLTYLFQCFSISRTDFLYKFPIETIDKVKMNFLVKTLRRYL